MTICPVRVLSPGRLLQFCGAECTLRWLLKLSHEVCDGCIFLHAVFLCNSVFFSSEIVVPEDLPLQTPRGIQVRVSVTVRVRVMNGVWV